MSPRRLTTTIALALVAAAILGAAPGAQILAAPASCGMVITEDTTLTGDITCSGTAIVIGADGVTLDLGGYTVTSLDGTGFGVDNTGGFDGVTVKNGAIGGFEHCIIADGASGFTVENVTIRPGWDNGIHAINSEDVTVKDSLFTEVPASSTGVVFNQVARGLVDNVVVDSGFAAVVFGGGSEDTGLVATSGTVKNCTLSNSFLGVLCGHAIDVNVEENTISGAYTGIRIGSGGFGYAAGDIRVSENEVYASAFAVAAVNVPPAGPPLPITGLEFVENHLHDNFAQGLTLVNVDDSVISENTIVDSGGFGIRIFFATGNEFTENTVTGHAVADMWATPDSTPNTWTGNSCGFSWGPDIDCP